MSNSWWTCLICLRSFSVHLFKGVRESEEKSGGRGLGHTKTEGGGGGAHLRKSGGRSGLGGCLHGVGGGAGQNLLFLRVGTLTKHLPAKSSHLVC